MAVDFDRWAENMMKKYGPDSGGDEAGDREPRKPKPKPSAGAVEKEPEKEKVSV